MNNLLSGPEPGPEKKQVQGGGEMERNVPVRYQKSFTDLAMEIGEELHDYMRGQMVNVPDRKFSFDEINGKASNIILGVVARNNFESNISKIKRRRDRKTEKNKLQSFVIDTVGQLIPAILKSMEEKSVCPTTPVSVKGKKPNLR